MKFLPSFLNTATQHLRAEALASPLATSIATGRTQTSTQPKTAPSAPLNMPTSTRLFVASSLATYGEVMTAPSIDRVLAQFSNPDVQRAAGELASKQRSLHELAAYRSAISRAVFAEASTGIAPVEFLRQCSEAVDFEIETTKQEHATHDAARKARLAALQPLSLAVSQHEIRASEERRNLLTRIDALKRNLIGNVDDGAHRHRSMVALGFSNEQINSVGVPQPGADSEQAIAAARERIAVLDGAIAQCLKFNADPFKSPEHLVGLGGFDHLIEARLVAEAALG